MSRDSRDMKNYYDYIYIYDICKSTNRVNEIQCIYYYILLITNNHTYIYII